MTTLPTMRKLMFGVVGAVRVVGVVAVPGVVSVVGVVYVVGVVAAVGVVCVVGVVSVVGVVYGGVNLSINLNSTQFPTQLRNG